MKIGILGVNVDKIGLPEIIRAINGWLGGERQRLIATVNPEFILAAQNNEPFRAAINSADIATADGVGLVIAASILRGEKLIRVTGVDLSRELLSGACPEARIYLLGGAEGVANIVWNKYPDGGIAGVESGGVLLPDKFELENNEAVIKRINESGANLLLVAFGQVKQEMWLKNNLARMPGVKIAIGVGGTFDYLSGAVGRAPAWMRRLGLEWLYRLIKEPRRWKRIWNATAVFGWKVAIKKLIRNS